MVMGSSYSRVLRNKQFFFLFTGQGISAFGDAFQLIALTAILIKLTGSGLAAGFAIICTPLSSLFLSPVAGILGDKLNSKRILIVFDVLRGATAALFAVNCKLGALYILTLLLSSFDILYSPVRNKFLTGLVDSNQLVQANSLQSGLFGIIYILGLLSAGITIKYLSVNTAFLVNSISFFISAFMILLIKYNKQSEHYKIQTFRRNSFGNAYRSFLKNLTNSNITNLLKIGMVIGFCTASINMTFYTFAFDKLGISNQMWSLLLSALYGTNLIAMLLSMVFIKKIVKTRVVYIYLLMAVISSVWFIYSTLENIKTVMFFQIIEGTTLSMMGILLGSYLLIESRKKYTARTVASYDFLGNIGKLAGISLTYLLLRTYGYKCLFVINSVVFFLFPLIRLTVGKIKFTGNIFRHINK